MKIKILEGRALTTEHTVKILEAMLGYRSTNALPEDQHPADNGQGLSKLRDSLPKAVFLIDCDATVIKTNQAALSLLGCLEKDVVGRPLSMFFEKATEEFLSFLSSKPIQLSCVDSSDVSIPVLMSLAKFRDTDETSERVVLCVDIRKVKQFELELRNKQKFESMGKLVSGIAHEINTPMQYIGDNLSFIGDSAKDLFSLIDAYERLKLQTKLGDSETGKDGLEEEAHVDIDYIRKKLPTSIDRVLDGVERIKAIISAIREFSHPNAERHWIDVNRLIGTATDVAVNEYVYVAKLKLQLSDIPPVYGNSGELIQVLINLIINSAQALHPSDGAKQLQEVEGVIEITTALNDDCVRITVSDNGCGIEQDVQNRMFDHLFTTKKMGLGTGQGLSVAYYIIANHKGKISYTTKIGKGTSFYIDLPVLFDRHGVEN